LSSLEARQYIKNNTHSTDLTDNVTTKTTRTSGIEEREKREKQKYTRVESSASFCKNISKVTRDAKKYQLVFKAFLIDILIDF